MKLFTSIAALCVPFVKSREDVGADSFGMYLDTAMDGDMARETATKAYPLYSEPETGTIISEPDFALLVETEDSEVRGVKFQYVDPEGTASEWIDAESQPGSNIWTYSISSYVGPGIYSWKFMTIDERGNELFSDSKTFEVELLATQYGDLKQMIIDNINANSNLAEDYVKLAYQDCRDRCDGCVDLTNGDQFGLSSVIDSLEEIWFYAKNDYGISRADIFTFAGLVGAEMSRSNRNNEKYPMEWTGRLNCEQIVYPCYTIDDSPVMCGPKVAPDYSDEGEQISSLSATANYGTMTFSDLSSVQDHGDVGMMKGKCDLKHGPCELKFDGAHDNYVKFMK